MVTLVHFLVPFTRARSLRFPLPIPRGRRNRSDGPPCREIRERPSAPRPLINRSVPIGEVRRQERDHSPPMPSRALRCGRAGEVDPLPLSTLAWTTETFESRRSPGPEGTRTFSRGLQNSYAGPGRYRARGMPGTRRRSRNRGDGRERANRRSRRESTHAFTATSTGSVMAVRRIDRSTEHLVRVFEQVAQRSGKVGIPASARTPAAGRETPPLPSLPWSPPANVPRGTILET